MQRTRAKQHHYVPKFYIERFADLGGKVWVFDKSTGKVFAASPVKLARERGFYEAPALGVEVDQSAMESMLSDLEWEASRIIARWVHAIWERPPGAMIVEDGDRDIMATYVATQALRTSEQRNLLKQGLNQAVEDTDLQGFHVAMLSDEFMRDAATAISDFIWILARNDSGSPFYTSDHPVVLRGHNHRCLHLFQFPQPGSELLFPLSSTLMFYAYERTYWEKVARFNGSISPVRFTPELVQSDNQAQVGHSRRFLFCDRDAFDFARSFCAEHPIVRDPNRSRFERH